MPMINSSVVSNDQHLFRFTFCNSERKITQICDNEYMALRCPENHGVFVNSAFYGRISIDICSRDVTEDTPTDCVAAEAEFILKKSCNLYERCSGTIGPGYFGDPCPGVPKYLTVSYDCVGMYIYTYSFKIYEFI